MSDGSSSVMDHDELDDFPLPMGGGGGEGRVGSTMGGGEDEGHKHVWKKLAGSSRPHAVEGHSAASKMASVSK